VTTASKASATRQKIIDAAVDLFVDHGFDTTGLTDITQAAGVTTGAFYYHFESKTALAKAIIEQGWPKAMATFPRADDGRPPGLTAVIEMTFELSGLLKRDRSVWISNHLNQAFGQLSEEGSRGFQQRATTFVARVASALAPGDIRDGVSTDEVGDLVWMSVHGCHLLSDALDDDVFDRLVTAWRSILHFAVPLESHADYEELLSRTAAHQKRLNSAAVSPSPATS
jgi:AcrR family transcriptional regulator